MNIKNVMYLSASRIVPVISSTIATLVVTAYFSVSEYGEYSIALSVFGLLSLFSRLGFSDFLLSNENLSNEIRKSSFALYKIITIIIPILLLPLIYISYDYSIFLLCIIVICFDGISRRLEEYSVFDCQINDYFKNYLYAKSTISITISIFRIYIVLMLNVSILHFVLYSSSIALLLNMIFFSKSIGKIIININFDYLKECIYECNREKKKIINFSVISLAYYIYFASDTFVLGLLSSSDEVAYYSVMLLIVSTCLIPVGAVWSNYIKSETNHLTLLRKKAIFIYMSFSLMVGFICIISAYLYVHFVNYEYVNIKELSYVFFLYFPIKYINVLYELVCVKSNNTDYLVKVRSIAAIANISLNIIIIPMLGALGAAITTLFVEAVIFILLFIKMRKEIGQ